MQILIAGASGLIGRALTAHFAERGDEVWGLTRNRNRSRKRSAFSVNWIRWDGVKISENLPGAFAPEVIINLAGKNLASGYWTGGFKEKLVESRLLASQALVNLVRRMDAPPAHFLQASAVGFYGSRGDEILDENSSRGDGFLADLAARWESQLQPLENSPVRCCRLRLGPVLSADGGMLTKMLPPFRLFLGGPLGSGRQWLSWIHIQEVVQAVQFLIDHPELSGPFNFTAPEPQRMKEFCAILGKVMNRPSFLPAPEIILKTVLGDMAREMLLSSQRALPKRLVTAGYRFKFPTLYVALAELLGKRELP